MEQVTTYPVIIPQESLTLETKRGIEFLIIFLVIIALPLERILLPVSLKIVDLPLVLLITYGGLRLVSRNQRIHVPLLWPFWLTLIAGLIATLTGLLSLNSVIAITQEVYLFTLFIVLTNILINYSQFDFDLLIKIWSIVAVVEATTAILGMMNVGPAIFYTSPIKGNILSTGDFNRAFGTFANPNATGSYLSISFFMLLAGNHWKHWTRLILGMYILVGIYSTGSMGAVFSTFASFLILMVMRSVYEHKRAAFLAGGVLALGLALFITLTLVYAPNQSLTSLSEASQGNALLSLTIGRLFHSVTGRVTLIEDVWHAYYRHPLGIGPDAATLVSGTLHNDYIAYLFERGPLGLIAWLWFVIATLLIPFHIKQPNRDKPRFWQLLILWSGFLAIILNAFTHEISHFRQMWVLMAFLYAAYYHLFSAPSESILEL